MSRFGAGGRVGCDRATGHGPREDVRRRAHGREDGDGERVKGGRAGADGASADGPKETC